MSDNNEAIKIAFEKLHQYVKEEGYRGYDPYDTLTSPFPFKSLGKWPSVIAIQLQKRNPLNVRPILGIRKDFNPKAIGLFLESYSILHSLEDGENKHKETAHLFFNWLLKNHTKGYSGYCWGYNFDWASPVKFLEAYSPTIVVSCFISRGIFEYYKISKHEKALEVLESTGEFIWKDLARTEDETGICLSYSTEMKDCCYNASMLGAEHFAKLYHLTKKEVYRERAEKITDFVIARQHDDGHWNYSIDMETGEERNQIDFHQGYVLDCIKAVIDYGGIDKEEYHKALESGLKFYRENQFSENGRAHWRYPAKWPTDIHNQSQGIITFSKFCNKDKSYLPLSLKMTKWAIDNMQHQTGYFYYRKYSSYKIRTPFMRWGQAWMFLAFVLLFKAQKECAE